MRFLSQMNRGSGNYTEERRELFEKLSLDEIRAGIRSLQASGSGESGS